MAAFGSVANSLRGRGSRLLLLRVLFVLLLGLDLTLVCQGHLHEGRYTDAHLTLIGEPADDAGAPVVSPAQDPKDVPGIASTSRSPEFSDLAGLGLVWLIIAAGTLLSSEPLPGLSSRRKSQVAHEPQAPPPRARLAPVLLQVSSSNSFQGA